MPDDSCRTCGRELIKHSRCSECRKIIQKICTVCNLKTHKEFHPKCMKLDLRQINNGIISKTIMANKKSKINDSSRNNIQRIILVSGFVIMVLTGLSITNYGGLLSFHNNQQIEQSNEKASLLQLDQKNSPTTMSNQVYTTSEQFKAQYVNCLGTSDGKSLTVNCPTDYGIAYRASVEIPNELVSQFESKSFHIRGFSVSEHSSGLLIEYQKQTYVSTFIAH